MENQILLTEVAECLCSLSLQNIDGRLKEIALILIEKEYLKTGEDANFILPGKMFVNYAYRRKRDAEGVPSELPQVPK